MTINREPGCVLDGRRPKTTPRDLYQDDVPFVTDSRGGATPARACRLVRVCGLGGGGEGRHCSFILSYTSLHHLYNHRVIYIVYKFMYVNYVLILKYRDVVVTKYKENKDKSCP